VPFPQEKPHFDLTPSAWNENALEFFLPRGAHVRNKPWIGSLVVFVIAASLAEAETAVDGSANHICIPVILPVILPPANLA
jgi:hypothetical protein